MCLPSRPNTPESMRWEPQLSKITYNMSLLILTGGYIPTLATFLLCKGPVSPVGNERTNKTNKANEQKRTNKNDFDHTVPSLHL